ncbi:S8 family serine peptidase [Leptolyngbya ohadii]|uniref:S8 family serine peptidase n=1 Tax=Leptolyngbya ohadii TaxID=1962290 RepID=UPI000B59D931|nr:S8 family serine peptidase [Leptolyngbya ohadii]
MKFCGVAGRLVGVVGGCGIVLAALPVLARFDPRLANSVGMNGIDALRLHESPFNLTGRKIAIGQVEIGRPAQFGLDKAAATNRSLQPRRLFDQNEPAEANSLVDEHATSVASIMISRDKALQGVAPNAVLYSSAAGYEQRNGQADECLATQTVANQNGGDVRAINFSFGESLLVDPRPNPVLDGNALLTQCVDWSARVHNVVYVISGNQGRGGYPIPTDTFNGMTIANSMSMGGVFTKVEFSSLGSEPTFVVGRDPATESNVGARRSVVLVAPGHEVQTIAPDGTPAEPATGTSFASPHVTATIALLQEFGDRQIRQAIQKNQQENSQQQTRWNLAARQQEVMRAVLMNSADKLRDTGDGLNLGMSRTFLTIANRTWLDSDAYTNPKISLDAEMGTGHLNAYRAVQQFAPGQWTSEQPVPAIGWDYSSVSSAEFATTPNYRDYTFEQPLQAGSLISATLTWNRLVQLADANQNGEFDREEQFRDRGLNNLDIYLMRAEDEDVNQSIGASISSVDSVEHLFQRIPSTGRYKLRVVYRDRVNDPTQSYALAWWGVNSR